MPELRSEIETRGRLPFAAPARDGGVGGRGIVRTPERVVRHDLRRQIAALERRLGELFASAFPRQGFEWRVGALGGPRILDSAELERVRDALVVRIREAEIELGRRGKIEEENRGLLEEVIADPDRHHWLRISNEDIGETGCRHWHSRPRWGVLGMLFGWWRVKLSSGCPLAKAGRPSPLEQEAQEARPEAPASAAADGEASPARAGLVAASAPR